MLELLTNIYFLYAAFYLNPKLQYNREVQMDSTHMAAVTKVFDFLHPLDDSSRLGHEVFMVLVFMQTSLILISNGIYFSNI